LVIGPGGVRGFTVLGFLAPLEDSGFLKYTDTFCGVSVGAIISLLIVAGYEVREILAEASRVDFFNDVLYLTKDIINQKGILSNEPIRRRLNQLMVDKFGNIPTLYDLYMKTGKAFVAVTLNVTDEVCEFMSPFTHPTISCVDATMFSMNIPFIFYQIVHKGKTYVDGALGNPYPVDYFDDGITNILGIYMKHPLNTVTLESPPTQESSSFRVYIEKVISSIIDQRRNAIMELSSIKCKHVCLQSSKCNIINLTTSLEEKCNMLVDGFNEGKKFLYDLMSDTVNPENLTKYQYQYPPYYMQPNLGSSP
jgi:predicted patatin/cPLA2 family phospholipase